MVKTQADQRMEAVVGLRNLIADVEAHHGPVTTREVVFQAKRGLRILELMTAGAGDGAA